METQTRERSAKGIGRAATLVGAVGLAGAAVTMALATTVFIGSVYGAATSSPAPGLEAIEAGGADPLRDPAIESRLDDYGIRCQYVGWCAMPPGQPQPSRSGVTDQSAATATGKAGATGRIDDYGIRCLDVGWCAMPPGQPQPSRVPARK
jgi:hypothetical protein